MTRARRLTVPSALAFLALSAMTALAYYTAFGSGNGDAILSTLAAPTNVATSYASGSTVGVSWTGVTAPDGSPATYYVQRFGLGTDPACGTSTATRISTTSCNDTNVPNGSYTYKVTAVFRTWTAQSAASTPAVDVVSDAIPPYVSSIVRAGSSPTSGGSVSWTVTFSEDVSGVDSSDFSPVNTGLGGTPEISGGITGGPAIYTVTATTGTGNGSLGLNLVDDNSIKDAAINPLGDSGGGTNGDFTGQVYAIDRAPYVSSIVRAGSSPTNAGSVSWTVTLSENVSGVDVTDFTLATTGLGGSPAITGVTGTGPTATYTVTASTGTGTGTVGLNLVDDDSIVDGVTNPLGDSVGGTDGTFTGEVYAIDGTAPFVSSVVRADSNPSTGSSVSWTVTFSEPVSGVGVGDFALVKTCLAGAPALTGVSGGPTVYTVSASTGSGSGTLGLNVIDDDSIIDAVTNALGASDGGADGRFTGEVYTTDGAPNVCSITRVGSSPTNASTVSWTVTFSEPVSGVGAADFTLVNASLGGSPAISGVAGTAPTATYTVTASTGSGNGSLGLNLVDDDSITDAAANKLGGVGAGNGSFIGQVYSIDRTPPTAFDIQGDPTGGSDSGTMDSGDKIVYTFSEEMSAGTILTGWTGSSTAVTVHVDHRGSASDCVTTNSCLKVTGANLGEVDLGSSVYAVNHGARYDLAATMEMATVAGRSVVTITLGATGGGDVDLTTTLKWTPSATAWDLAGNAASTTQVTESGAPKQNF